MHGSMITVDTICVLYVIPSASQIGTSTVESSVFSTNATTSE